MLKFKKGDTLIEVMLAIGVFSMVAISVVAVISSSSAGAEMNLETTLTRQEIDAQADALRFIHTAAVADHTAADNRYYRLWQTITEEYAVKDLNTKNEEVRKDILQYAPASCDEVYTFKAGDDGAGGGVTVKPFIINTRAIGDYASKEYGTLNFEERNENNDIAKVIIANEGNNLQPTATYPHLSFDDATATSGLVADPTSKFLGADGIYIIAVADPKSTYYVGGAAEHGAGQATAYYDFYIRTCWYGINENRPSTISTLIRLHEPNIANADTGVASTIVRYDANGGIFASTGIGSLVMDCDAETCSHVDETPTWEGHKFLGWESVADSSATYGQAGESFRPGDVGRKFKAVWQENPKIVYHAKRGSNNARNGFFDRDSKPTTYTQYCSEVSATAFNCHILNSDASPVANHYDYRFVGWTASADSDSADSRYAPGTSLTRTPREGTLNLYAVYDYRLEITFLTNASDALFWIGGLKSIRTTTACITADRCVFPSEPPTRSGYLFLGYATSPDAVTPNYPYNGSSYSPNSFAFSAAPDRKLYAVWQEHNEEIIITLSWTGNDYDSHYVGYDSLDKKYHAWYSQREIFDTRTNNRIVYLNTDCTSGTCTEISTVQTLGGKDYYYYVHNYTNKTSTITGATVTVKGRYTCPSTCTYYSNSAPGTGGYWNVFSIQSGRYIVDQTQSSVPTSGVLYSDRL